MSDTIYPASPPRCAPGEQVISQDADQLLTLVLPLPNVKPAKSADDAQVDAACSAPAQLKIGIPIVNRNTTGIYPEAHLRALQGRLPGFRIWISELRRSAQGLWSLLLLFLNTDDTVDESLLACGHRIWLKKKRPLCSCSAPQIKPLLLLPRTFRK